MTIQALTHELSALAGQIVTRVTFDSFAVDLLLGDRSDYQLRVECYWEYKDAQGRVLDKEQPTVTRDRFELWRLVGHKIFAIRLSDNPLVQLEIEMEDNYKFVILAEDNAYEDWSLGGTNLQVICIGNTVISI